MIGSLRLQFVFSNFIIDPRFRMSQALIIELNRYVILIRSIHPIQNA